jgi:hypothetical protein
MRTLFPLLVLLSLASATRADFAMPGTKPLNNTAVVRFGPEAEGYRIFLLCDDTLYEVDRAADTVRFAAPYTRGTLPRLCAVPVGVAVNTNSGADLLATAGVVCSDGLPVYRGRDWFFNPHDGAEMVFQARITPTAVEVELIEERAVWSWPTVIVMGALSLALALGGIWLVRRTFRRPVTRTGPPPGT